MIKTAEEIRAAQEILGRLEGLRNYIKTCKAAGNIDQIEYLDLMRPVSMLDTVARKIVAIKETRHIKAGGMFNKPINPKMEVSKVYRS